MTALAASILPGDTRVAFGTVLAIAEAIRGLGSVPSGHLYAQVCCNLTLAQYEEVIRTLKGAGLISETAHELRWIGPEVKA